MKQWLEAARREAHAGQCSVLQALGRLGGYTREQLLQALGQAFAYEVAGAAQLQALRADFDLIAYPDCERRGIVLGWDIDQAGNGNGNDQAILVLTDPFDAVSEDWALRRCAPLAPRIMLAHEDELRAYLELQEARLRAIDQVEASGVADGGGQLAAVISLGSIRDDASAVVKLVNSTLYDALKLGASDIHLECDGPSLHVLYRIDGVLLPVTVAQGAELARQVISRIKVMAELDIAESRIPQDGRFRIQVNQREIDLRVSIMPNIFGEDAVLRLLDRQALTQAAGSLDLEGLGLPAAAVRDIRRLASKPHGMLLVTGPTGSGKTTTLYAAITEIHTGRDKIITIEDPVEYRLARVLQIPVNEKKGLSFARGLRSILRHDPDKIMVGEIRDGETAQIAVQAALTGHLVLTTVHANSAFDVLGRLRNMGVDAYSLASALNGIVAQRLVRMLCPDCAVHDTPGAQALEEVGLAPAQVAQWQVRAARGCPGCRGSGYRGRRSVAEVLVLDDTLREMIASTAPVSALREHARRGGMVPIRQALWQWVARGDTSMEEVARVAG